MKPKAETQTGPIEASADASSGTKSRHDLHATRELLIQCISMLRDLHENFGWDELHTTMEDVEAQAAELGIVVEPKSDPRGVFVVFHVSEGEQRTTTLAEAIDAEDEDVRFAEIFRVLEDGKRDSLTLTGDAWRILQGRLPDALKTLNQELTACGDMEDALRAVVDWAEYRFQHCGQVWTSPWSCAANDKCPECGKEIEPIPGEEVVFRSLEEDQDGHFTVHIPV